MPNRITIQLQLPHFITEEARMADTEKYIAGVKKYTATVNEGAVAGIVRHCGIALRSKDASLVAATDPEELKRVRESWLKKKLALTESDEALDKAIQAVMTKMKGDRAKERVTVYYLLAEHYGKLGELVAKPKAAKPAKK
jgi:hypothetical protein